MTNFNPASSENRSHAPSLIVGVDPGFTGAVAIYEPATKKLVECVDMPLLENKVNGRREIDHYKLAVLIEYHRPHIKAAIIEEVGPRPKEGVTGVFRFGFGAGITVGIVAAAMVPIYFTKPSVWKMLMGLSSDKNLSLELARKLFPEQAGQLFSRQKDNGRAEAALLAVFGTRLFPPTLGGAP